MTRGGSLHLALAALAHRSRWALAGTLAVFALVGLAIVTGLQVRSESTAVVDDLAEQANVADLVVTAADPETLTEVAAEPMVTGSAGPYVLAYPDLLVGGGAVQVKVTGTGAEEPSVGRPLLRGGRWLDGPGEVVLDRSLARRYGIAVGRTVTLRGTGGAFEAQVVGLTIDLTDCAVPQCEPGRVFADPEQLTRIAGGASWSILQATVSEPAEADAVATDLLRRYGDRITGTNTWPDTRDDFVAVDRIFGAFLSGFGAFLLVASAVVVAGSTSARMVQRRREVGLTKALGATPGQLVRAFVAEQLLLAGVGVVLGWVVGSLVAPYLQVGLADAFGRSPVAFVPAQLVVALLVVGLVVLLTTMVPCWRAARTPAVDALRDAANPSSAMARAAGRARRPSVALGVGEIAARPLRTALAVTAVGVAVVGTLVASAFIATMDRAGTDPSLTGDPWNVSVLAGPTTAARIEAVLDDEPEVARWFTEQTTRASARGRTFLSRAVGGPMDGPRYEMGGGRDIEAVGEAIVGYALLDYLDVEVGDELTVDSAGVALTMTVVGWYRETEDSGRVLVHRAEQLAADPSRVPSVWLAQGAPGIDRELLAARLATALGPIAAVRAIDVDADLGPFTFALSLIAGLVVLVAALHLVATWLTSTRERARELGVLRTIGGSDRQLIGQHALGGATIAALAAAVSVPVALVVNRILGDAVTTEIGAGPGLTGHPSLVTVVVTVLAAVGLSGALAAAVSAALLRHPTPTLVRYE